MTPRILCADEAAMWDAWLRGAAGSNVRQTSLYSRALELYGHRSEIVALEDSNGIAGGALLGIRRFEALLGTAVHASGGLALRQPVKGEQGRNILLALLDRASALRASSLEVSFRIARGGQGPPAEEAAALERSLVELGFKPSKPLETYVVDLSRESDEALLASFGKNKRRDIRRAQREGIEIARSTDPADFDGFEETHRLMGRRKGVAPFPDRFGIEVLLPLVRSGHAELYVARFKGIVRNYLFIGCTGLPTYTWGALAAAGRAAGCPPTGELLQFSAMTHFRKLGRTAYDLGGTPGSVPDPSHPNFTVWKFKHDFCGTHVRYLGSWKRTLRPTSAALISLSRRALGWSRRAGLIGSSRPS